MEQQVVDWKGLKAIGIPYCRAHIWREMKARRFPQAFKLGKHRNSHPVWWLALQSSKAFSQVSTRSDGKQSRRARPGNKFGSME
jgi:hypothetical protein